MLRGKEEEEEGAKGLSRGDDFGQPGVKDKDSRIQSVHRDGGVPSGGHLHHPFPGTSQDKRQKELNWRVALRSSFF